MDLASTQDYTGSASQGEEKKGVGVYGFFNAIINMIRFFFGLGLLVVGGRLAYYILLEIHGAYLDIKTNEFVSTLIEWLSDKPLFLDTLGEPFLLGEATATIVAVFLACFVALIAIRVALLFFTTGVRVLTLRFEG